MSKFIGINIPKERYQNTKLRLIDKFSFNVTKHDMKLQEITIKERVKKDYSEIKIKEVKL